MVYLDPISMTNRICIHPHSTLSWHIPSILVTVPNILIRLNNNSHWLDSFECQEITDTLIYHPHTLSYLPVHPHTFLNTLIHSCALSYFPIHSNTFLYTLIPSWAFSYLLVHSDTFLCTLIPSCAFSYLLVHSHTFLCILIPSCTL